MRFEFSMYSRNLLAIALLITCQSFAMAEAPTVVGYDRFAGGESEDLVLQGTILLGELNCTSCHKPTKELAALILPKAAPDLKKVGSRIQPEFFESYLTDIHGMKPGSTMPDLMHGMSANEKKDAAKALAHFLATKGTLAVKTPNKKNVNAGRDLYERVGCLACHGPQGDDAKPVPNSISLKNIENKYTTASLTEFLKNPLNVRHSGRMPAFQLKGDEFEKIATYLTRNSKFSGPVGTINQSYKYYEGNYDSVKKIPFDKKPKKEGKSIGYDTSIGRKNEIGYEFTGYLIIKKAGKYQFTLTSDDGSQLLIDDKEIILNDGVHPATTKSGQAELSAGPHKVVTRFFDSGGDVVLGATVSGSGFNKTPLDQVMLLTPETKPAVPDDPDAFVLNNKLAETGRELFSTIGCASCHQMDALDKNAKPSWEALDLELLPPSGGCIAAKVTKNAANYQLSAGQTKALSAAIKAINNTPAKLASNEFKIDHTLKTFNCYACHNRGEIGGVEDARNAFFKTNQKEMGDEGRIPPALTGVGAKLRKEWMDHLFNNGGAERDYMLTLMPKFGPKNVGHLTDALAAVDKIEPVPIPDFGVSERKVKAAGRKLVGDKGLGCVKCHRVGKNKATGIQAIDFTLMNKRLNRDWFRHYMLKPNDFRPGTRMPEAWPRGQVFFKDVLDGTVEQQIESVWVYLKDGSNIAVPLGLGQKMIEIAVTDEAKIYRNFIKDAGPRAIGVGYPGGVNIAFDANELKTGLIWQNAFMDASRHWVGRGQGFQPPLGDNVIKMPAGPGYAVLESLETAWPNKTARESQDQKFRGYSLDKIRRPTFNYEVGSVKVADFSQSGKDQSLKRTLTFSGSSPAAPTYTRIAEASAIAEENGSFKIDNDWSIKVSGDIKPILRKVGSKQELLIPVAAEGSVVIEYLW